MRTVATRPPKLPSHIGKYRVLGHLGEGATSQVFHARDEFHARDVAIKCVRTTLPSGADDGDDAHLYDRFFAAEAALVGRLSHPNVVQIFDAVADPVQPYLVMEYVSGTTLRTFCQPDALLSLEQIVEIGFKCAMALGYVYRLGLIHRDVKPANLLAVMDGKQVVDLKITDFGSVLQLDAERTQVHRVGSLAYMSPEQLDGSALGCGADIYSLAAVLYHLVAGRPPFEGPTQPALMHQVFNEEPAPLTGLRDGIPVSLDGLIRRALAKQPADRPASWDEFAQGLSGLVARREVPRGRLQGVLDSERFNMLRALEFFAAFGDVELWEVVHRAKWQRFAFGHALYKKGQPGGSFHILAQGEVEVFRDGRKVASLGHGTSVGEMAYLAPNEDLRLHRADVIVTLPCTTVSFTPATLGQLSAGTRHRFDDAFIKVLVRRLHAAHELLEHPRRIL
jgi:CRP-like cAMP-binding protein/tRNA A-37 threonylcarbamoyl transferase component Bud32